MDGAKKTKTKNYVILIVIIVVTIMAVFYCRSWYLETKSVYATDSAMLNVIKEINEDEISNYTLENPRFILYVASGQNGNIKNFENDMIGLITDEELENYFLYLNLDKVNVSDLKDKLKDLTDDKQIQKNIDIRSNVSMFVIENGRITKAITQADNLSISKIKNLLKTYGVIDNA